MSERELRNLEDPETWDYERAQKQGPAKRPRAIVSVAFAPHDFERVAASAEQLGTRTSTFIREAALDRASGRVPRGMLFSFTATSFVRFSLGRIITPVPATRVSARAWPLHGQLAATA